MSAIGASARQPDGAPFGTPDSAGDDCHVSGLFQNTPRARSSRGFGASTTGAGFGAAGGVGSGMYANARPFSVNRRITSASVPLACHSSKRRRHGGPDGK